MLTVAFTVIPAGLVSALAVLSFYTRNSASRDQLREAEEAEAFIHQMGEDMPSRSSSMSSYYSLSSGPPSPVRRLSLSINVTRHHSHSSSSLKMVNVASLRRASPPSRLFATLNDKPTAIDSCQDAPEENSAVLEPLPCQSTLHDSPSDHSLTSQPTASNLSHSSFTFTLSSPNTSSGPMPSLEPSEGFTVPLLAPQPPPRRPSLNRYHGRQGWGGYRREEKIIAAPEEDEEVTFFPAWGAGRQGRDRTWTSIKTERKEEEEEEEEEEAREEEYALGLPPISVDAAGRIIKRPLPLHLHLDQSTTSIRRHQNHTKSFSSTSATSSSSSSSSSCECSGSEESGPCTPIGVEKLSFLPTIITTSAALDGDIGKSGLVSDSPSPLSSKLAAGQRLTRSTSPGSIQPPIDVLLTDQADVFVA